MKKSFEAIKELSEFVSTRRSTVDKTIDKSAIGVYFATENLTGDTATIDTATIGGVGLSGNIVTAPGLVQSQSEMRVTGTVAGNPTILRHIPSDGDEIRIGQSAVDNSLFIRNESTNVAQAVFYRNGRTSLDLVDSSIYDNHVAYRTLGGDSMQDDVVGSRILQIDAVDYENLSGDTKNKGRGTSSLRQLSGSGSSLQGSSTDHTHLSVNFNTSYTLAEKDRSANLKTAVEDMRTSPIHTQIYPLIDLVLDLAHQLLDDIDMTVTEKVRRIKEDPAFAHEFRMKYDSNYFAAWMIDNTPEYAQKVEDDAEIQDRAAKARAFYGQVESTPEIVAQYKRKYPNLL